MSERYPCPKCGKKYMVKNGHTHGGKQRWVCTVREGERMKDCYKTADPTAPYRDNAGRPINEKPAPPVKHRVKLSGVQHLVVTWAQNATPVHEGFLASLETYCAHHEAQLVVIAGRYKNPTSVWSDSQRAAEVWAPELKDYLQNQRKKLNANLVLAADVKSQPTAVTPLTGFEGLTGGESCLLGHPKVQLKCVPSPQSQLPKILSTTGAITLPNYTDSRAGKLGEFHHTIGAVIVEMRGAKFHMRHVTARDDGAFIDLDHAYHPEGIFKAEPYKGIVFGDAHYRFADMKVVEATFGKGGLVETLDPKVLVWHDLLDSYAITAHHDHNPMIRLAKFKAGYNDIEREVIDTVGWLRRKTKKRQSVVVASNHDDMISRWILRANWKDDPTNAEFYLETALQVARSARMETSGAAYLDPFQHWVKKLTRSYGSNIRCLARGESFMLGDVECGMHGDDGPNGARGTVRNLSRLGVKAMTGHGHSPAIEEGHTRVGTMTYLNLEYTRGPGSWLNAHGAVDAFGKRHLYMIIDGGFTYQ